MRSEPVFILGAHKSGTSLLRNLIDGHSEVFAIPFESHFFQYYGYWVLNNYRYSKPKKYSNDELIKVFTDFIQANNEADDKFGDAFVYGKFNVEIFANHFANLNSSHSINEAFQLFVEATHLSLFKKPLEQDALIVEKSVEHAEFACDIQKAYPNAKFIHVVRNPYSNLVSLRKYKSMGFGYPLIHRVLHTLENSYYYLEKNQRLLDNYLVIRYEDLVQNPEEWMNRIADYVGITFSESLLNPTSLSGHWQGNSTTGTKFTGVSSGNLDKWKTEIQPMEVDFANRLFAFTIDKYDYELFQSSGNFWSRCKGESLSRYFANRLYKQYLKGWA